MARPTIHVLTILLAMVQSKTTNIAVAHSDTARMLGGCADFRGGYVACNELQQARALNQQLAIDPLAAQTNYHGVRQLLNAHGLRGADWHVGHRSPNERGTPRTGAGAG